MPGTSGSPWLASISTTRRPRVDLDAMFETFARSARALQGWYDGGRRGPRPPGRLRPLDDQQIPSRSRWWAEPLYRTVYDPDARSIRARVRGRLPLNRPCGPVAARIPAWNWVSGRGYAA